MSLTQIAFYIFSATTFCSALFILLTKNVLYAAFGLLGTFLGVAAIYVFAMAEFIAITQIMIYVGGVLLLVIFGIMLTNRVQGIRYILSENKYLALGLATGTVLFAGLSFFLVNTDFRVVNKNEEQVVFSNVKQIGQYLMTTFMFPFEVIAIILMVALIGSVFIAGKSENTSSK